MANHYAGIVLCGGRSSRMGYPKALLPFGPELMLQRMVRLMRAAAGPIVVVAAPGQELPPLPADVIVVHDRREGRGPLEGLAAGLAELPATASAAYVTSCDVPLLRPAFVRRMIELHAEYEIAVPFAGGFHHPLAAVYSKTVLPHVERLLGEDRLRPVYLFEVAQTRVVAEHELRGVDPELASLHNLNQPADYQAALAEAGFPPRDMPSA
jgi:molybdopterin-guanine dinucleotide biosynthesis protein A